MLWIVISGMMVDTATGKKEKSKYSKKCKANKILEDILYAR
jgi:hypothetical protein